MAEILHPGQPPAEPSAYQDNYPTLEAPSNPHQEPFGQIKAPEHVSTGLWQQSWYDPTSMATVSNYAKLPSGPCDIRTGQLTGDGFPDHADGGDGLRGFGQV